MPYTLMKGLVWVLLAVLLGIVIGWLLRSVAAKRQVDRARAAGSDHDQRAELERLRARVANLEPIVAERDRLAADLSAARSGPAAVQGFAAVPDDAGEPAADVLDLEAAAAALGRAVRLDDLTVIEGIGPKIAELCQGIGISTWSELAATEVSLLRTMLDDAGPRFKTHDPTTWPQQAGLLASGAWSEFRELTDRLDGGRAVD